MYYITMNQINDNNYKYILIIISAIALAIITLYILITLLSVDENHTIYRGFMLDTSRQFFPVESITKILDEMHKYNYTNFHWSLSNNERFSYLSQFDNGELAMINNNTKYYTNDDLLYIYNYAKNLSITVLTEFAFMGHVKIWNDVYPELMSDDYNDEFNMNNKEVYNKLTDLFNEVIPYTTSKYTHMSNDEISQQDSEIIKSLNFALEQAELYNKIPIIWDDSIIERNINVSKKFTIQAWHNNATNTLLKKKYKVIISEMDYWYIGGLHDMEIMDFKFPNNNYIAGAELVWFTNFTDNPIDIDWIFPYIKNAGIKMSEL